MESLTGDASVWTCNSVLSVTAVFKRLTPVSTRKLAYGQLYNHRELCFSSLSFRVPLIGFSWLLSFWARKRQPI